MSDFEFRWSDIYDGATVVAITGPPASGKSTVAGMFEDIGIPCKDTGEAVREKAREHFDDPNEDDMWEMASRIRQLHGDEGPTKICEQWIIRHLDDHRIICLSSLRDQAEVEWLRENVGPTLVIRVDADSYARSERYVRDQLPDDEDRESVDYDQVREIREELYDRELRESPYPQHDVTIRNEDGVGMHEIMRRLENVVEVIEA